MQHTQQPEGELEIETLLAELPAAERGGLLNDWYEIIKEAGGPCYDTDSADDDAEPVRRVA